LRCHEITVSGRTMTRTDFQSRQIARSPIQKSRHLGAASDASDLA